MVSTGRLNIYLSKSEADRENISLEIMADETYNIKDKLSRVFSEAYNSTGFDCFDSKLKIEFVPLMDGDILISVKKLEGDKTKVFVKHRILVFEFESFDILAQALLVAGEYYKGRESIYKFEGNYYLVVYIHSVKICNLSMLKLKLSEFGTESSLSFLVLREHGQKIASGNGKDAVKRYWIKE